MHISNLNTAYRIHLVGPQRREPWFKVSAVRKADERKEKPIETELEVLWILVKLNRNGIGDLDLPPLGVGQTVESGFGKGRGNDTP